MILGAISLLKINTLNEWALFQYKIGSYVLRVFECKLKGKGNQF
jgi:hypothetical protein